MNTNKTKHATANHATTHYAQYDYDDEYNYYYDAHDECECAHDYDYAAYYDYY